MVVLARQYVQTPLLLQLVGPLMLTSIPGAFATQNNLASDTVGYGMYDTGRREGSDDVWEYKTLAKLTANDTALTVTRPVQQYITSSFLYRWGWSIGSDGDGYVHVFAKGGTNANGTINMYAAKVPFDDIEDTSKVSILVSNQSSHFAFESPHCLFPHHFAPPLV